MFFTQINQMMSKGVDITLVIRKNEGNLTVATLPNTNGLKDEAQNHIVPLTISGTPEELDAGFFPALCQPIQKAAGLLTNMSQFEKQAELAAASSKAAKELKDKQAKEAKEKKEKFDKLMKKAEELETEHKLSEALTNLQQARTLATPQAVKSVDDKIATIRFKLRQGSLFDEKPEVQSPPQQQQTIAVNQPQQPVQTPVVNGQPNQQTGVNGYAVQNGNPPISQPQQQPMQQPVQQSMNGNGQYMQYQSVINGNQQPQPPQPQTQPHAAELNFDMEPQPVFTADYSAYREGEYDQYPDFPGYSNNGMYNQ